MRQRTLAIGAGQGLRGRYGSGGLGRAGPVGFGFGDAAEGDPAGAGSRFRLVVPFLGPRMSLTYEVIRRVPGHEVLLAATSGVLRSTDRIAVTGGEDRSMVSYEAEVRLRGPLQVLDPVLRPGDAP